MDGLSATREIIRLDPQARIIVCTADIQVRSLEQAREAGALTVVRKPPSKETVVDAISFAETRG